MFDECYFPDCNDPPTVEGIAIYDRVFGVEQTVALALCRRHADALRDELLLLEVASIAECHMLDRYAPTLARSSRWSVRRDSKAPITNATVAR